MLSVTSWDKGQSSSQRPGALWALQTTFYSNKPAHFQPLSFILLRKIPQACMNFHSQERKSLVWVFW